MHTARHPALLVLFLAAACGRAPSTGLSSFEARSARWSPEGGYAFSPDGRLAVDAPFGVFEHATTVRIEAWTPPDARSLRSPVYRLVASDSDFRTPLTLDVDLEPEERGATHLQWIHEDGRVEPVPGCAPSSSGIICFDVAVRSGARVALAEGPSPAIEVPETVTTTLTGPVSFRLGDNWGCGEFHRAPGDLVCWGDPAEPQARLRPAPWGLSRTLCRPSDVPGAGAWRCWGPDAGAMTPPPGAPVSGPPAVGARHACGLELGSREARCYGDDAFGQSTPPSAGPPIPPEERRCRYTRPRPGFYQISAGRTHTCALREDGWVQCWGRIDGRPAAEVAPAGMFDALYGSGDGTCARALDGTIECWGGGLEGVPDDARFRFSQAYVRVGLEHACALTTRRTVRCWGPGAAYASPPPDLFVVGLEVGRGFTCVNTQDAVRCWGRDDVGQASPPEL